MAADCRGSREYRIEYKTRKNQPSTAKPSKENLRTRSQFEGKTVSQFILTSALAHAEKTIHEHEVLNLNQQDSEAFLKALEQSVRFNKKLTAAFEEHELRVIHK